MKKAKLVKGAGTVFGTMLECNLLLAGAVIGGIAIVAGKKGTGKTIVKAGKNIGKFAGKAAKASANLAGTVIEVASSEGAVLGKAIGRNLVQSRVRIYGDSSAFYDKDKIIEADYNEIE